MMLDLRALKSFPARVLMEEEAADWGISVVGLSTLGKARMELDIVQSDSFYYCSGQVVCDAQLECSRCLEPVPALLKGELDFSIHRVEDEKAVNRDEVPDNELIVPANVSQVDISGPVREALILEIPLQPLCADDCLGLCPLCGTNLNEQTCKCKKETTDHRWDGLRDLL